MRKVRKFIFITFILIACPTAYAQSFFSIRGLGEEIINTDAVMTSLGSTISLSYQNPSYPLLKENMIFQAGIMGSGVYATQSKNHRFIADARPNYLKALFALPFDFGLGLGLSERFNQNFNIYSDTTLRGYQRQIIGYGGIYSFEVRVAKSFYKHIGLGFEYNRHFGSGYEQWFFQALPSITITTDTIATKYRGDGLKFGIYANLRNFNLGAIYEKDLPIYIDSRVLSHGAVTDSVSGLKFELPPRIGFGLSFNLMNDFTICLDYFYRNSQAAKINDSTRAIYHNSNKYSIGLVYNRFEQHPMRIGYRYYDWYFADHTDKIINEQAITLGSGIPIPKFGSLELALELINRRGSSLTENICRLNFTLHYEEAWKIRKRRWGY